MGVSITLMGKFKNNKNRLAKLDTYTNNINENDIIKFKKLVDEEIISVLDKMISLRLVYKITFESSFSKSIEYSESVRADAVSIYKAIDRVIGRVISDINKR